MSWNRVAWVVVVLGGLAAAGSIAESALGAHVILLAVVSAIFTMAAARGAYKLQVRHDDKWFAEFQRDQQLALEHELDRSLEERRLDGDCADLLRRADAAVQVILSLGARAGICFTKPSRRSSSDKKSGISWPRVSRSLICGRGYGQLPRQVRREMTGRCRPGVLATLH